MTDTEYNNTTLPFRTLKWFGPVTDLPTKINQVKNKYLKAHLQRFLPAPGEVSTLADVIKVLEAIALFVKTGMIQKAKLQQKLQKTLPNKAPVKRPKGP